MRISGILAATAVVAVLAGCGAPTPIPIPTVSPSPTASEPVPVVRAEPVLPLTCDELVPPALVGSIVRQVGRVVDGSGPVDDVFEVDVRQAGALDCQWRANEGGPYISISVVPDPARYTDYDGWMLADTQYVEVGRFGDESRDYCGWGSCYAQLLVGTFAIEAWITVGPDVEPVGEDERYREVDTVLASVADRVRAASASARPVWERPAGVLASLPGFCGDTSPALPVLAAGLGVGKLRSSGGDEFSPSQIWAQERAGVESCGVYAVRPDRYGWWRLVPGGAWALDDLGSVPTQNGLPPRIVEVDAEGVDGGRVVLRSGAIIVPVGGSLAAFSFGDYSDDQLLALVPTVVEAARASAR